MGKSILPVIVRNRYGTQLSWFSPRFGTRSYKPTRSIFRLSWDNAPKSTIQILGLWVLPKRGKERSVQALMTDELDVHLAGEGWAAGEPLELELLIEAGAPWTGRFSFYSRNTKHDKRAWGDAKIEISLEQGEWDARPLEQGEAAKILEDTKWQLQQGQP